MAAFYSPERIQELAAGYVAAQQSFATLREAYALRNYKHARAKEFALHGFSRRLGMLIHSIERVYSLLPPEREDVPTRDDVLDASNAIQAFIINAQGCIDNLAWVLVYERDVREQDGSELEPKRVGLTKQNRRVWKSLSPEFRAYMSSRREWLKYLTGFRDSLAHRIPLYIPPYVITPDKQAEYDALGEAADAAVGAGNLEQYDQLTYARNAMGVFQPLMTHSFSERSPRVPFHVQLLADFNTIEEMGREMLTELDREVLALQGTRPSWWRSLRNRLRDTVALLRAKST